MKISKTKKNQRKLDIYNLVFEQKQSQKNTATILNINRSTVNRYVSVLLREKLQSSKF